VRYKDFKIQQFIIYNLFLNHLILLYTSIFLKVITVTKDEGDSKKGKHYSCGSEDKIKCSQTQKHGTHTGRADCCLTDSCIPTEQTEEQAKANLSSKTNISNKMFIFFATLIASVLIRKKISY
jgi:hypothetical protein